MDFEIPEKTRTTLEMIEEFVDKELTPLEYLFLNEPFRKVLPKIEEKRLRVKQMGLWAPGHAEKYGGMGLDLLDLALVSEALGGCPFGHFVFGCHAPDAGNIEVLHQHGTKAQKKKWLGPLVTGEIRSCFSMTEPEMPGSNPLMMETQAIKDGDDYVITGQKWYTTAADGAAVAVVMAVTNPEAPAHQRASMILVPTDTRGFERVRNIQVMGEAGEGFFSHSEILYQSCRVPQANRLGPEGHGFVIAQERLGPGRIHHCMRWLGICNRALDLMCSRAKARAMGDGVTLADKEIIQAWIAECAAEIRAARMLTLHTAWLIERHGWKAARQDISMIKFLVAGTLQKVIDRALQVHGGLGMTDDTVLAFFYRHERAARIYDGPDEVHKLSLARRILAEKS
ncbi:MAG: acyl-CoA dehydrogenase family protein [Acidobacteriota bacterium]|nr:acyl-CoA dehydrogenase family protein [Acidobacteriota bacterium]